MAAVLNICHIIFLVSLLYYVLWLGLAVYCAIWGVDSGWAMPAMSKHKKEYGLEAFWSGIVIGLLITYERFLFIPIFQAAYLVVRGIIFLVSL